LVLALLAACADNPPPQTAAAQRGRHESPAPVEAPTLPPGSFDQAQAQAELADARAARQAGNAAEARRLATAATEHWPADTAAWEELQTDCAALKDDAGRQRAAFFLAKVDLVKDMPAHAAVLAFQNMAEEPVGSKVSGVTYDQPMVDTAHRLWAFYHTQDQLVALRTTPREETLSEKYPYLPMGIATAVVAGLLTEAKTLANK
jgi:hypothetical protein